MHFVSQFIYKEPNSKLQHFMESTLHFTTRIVVNDVKRLNWGLSFRATENMNYTTEVSVYKVYTSEEVFKR